MSSPVSAENLECSHIEYKSCGGKFITRTMVVDGTNARDVFKRVANNYAEYCQTVNVFHTGGMTVRLVGGAPG